MTYDDIYIIDYVNDSPYYAKDIERRSDLGNGTINNLKRGSLPNIVLAKKIMDALDLPLEAAFIHPKEWKKRQDHIQYMQNDKINNLELQINEIRTILKLQNSPLKN